MVTRNGTAVGGGFLDSMFRFLRGRSFAEKEPLGAGGTQVVGGYLVRADRDARLQGQARYTTFSENLANVDIIAAGVRHYLDLIGAASWRFMPVDESEEAKRLAEQVEKILHDMETPLFRVVRRAATFKLYGFAVSEWTAKMNDDGVVGLFDVEPRPQATIERWDVDFTGTVHGMVQRSPHDSSEIYLPRAKVLYLVDDALDDSPEGHGLFRACAPHAKLLTAYEKLERIGYQSDISGIPIGRVPLALLEEAVTQGRISKEERDAKVQVVMDFLAGHVKSEDLAILLDSTPYESTGDGRRAPGQVRQWDVEVMKSTPTAQEFLAAAVERKTRSIARILGVEHLLLGSDSRGSNAMAEGKTKSFGLLVDSALSAVRASIESDLICRLFELNGWPFELMPIVTTDLSRFRDITEITTALKDMATAGAPMAPDDEVQNAVRGMLGLSPANLKALAEAAEVRMEAEQAAAQVKVEAVAQGADAATGDPKPKPEPDDNE